MVEVPWLAGLTLAAGVANAGLLWYLWPRRESPGGWWFIAVIAVQVLWAVAYGLNLLTAAPMASFVLELLVWVAVTWIGVTYFAFALAYTGRGHLLRTPWFGALLVTAVGGTIIVLTAPWHDLLLTNFRVDPVLGAATVAYDREAWVFVQFGIVLILASLGFFVLLDTVVSYGPLYRTQAIALALTPLPPAAAFALWTFELGPYPQLNLTPIMFIPHMLLDSYALFSEGMFEFSPATRRTAERSGIDDLGSPVVITDPSGRVVNLNAAAENLLSVDKREALGEDLAGLLGHSLDVATPSQELTVRRDGDARTLVVTANPLRDASDTLVGYAVDMRDVTDERRREQRLAVLNRVLRHNLRNDLTVVAMSTDMIDDAVEDPDLAEHVARIDRQVDGLRSLGEKARDAATALEGIGDPVPVDVERFLEHLADGYLDDYPDAPVRVDVPEACWLETTPARLELAVGNALENALEHGGDAPEITLAAEPAPPDAVRIQVRDDGPGIPEHELSVVASGEETDLEHGSGIGLWLIQWGVDAVGGDVEWATPAEGGTLVTITVPGRREAPPDEVNREA